MGQNCPKATDKTKISSTTTSQQIRFTFPDK